MMLLSFKKATLKLVALLLFTFCNLQIKAQPPENDLAAYFVFDSSTLDLTEHLNCVKKSKIQFDQSRRRKQNEALRLGKKSELVYNENSDSLSFNSTQKIFFCFWIKADLSTSDSNQYLVSKNFPSKKKQTGYALRINKNGEVEFVAKISANNKSNFLFNTQEKIKDNKWHFVELGIDSKKGISFSIDFKRTVYSDSISIIPTKQDSLFYVGTNSHFNEHYSGLMDDMRIYKFFPSELERNHIYREGVLTNYILIPLNNEANANNSCTFMVGLDPIGDKIIFNTGKYEKMSGYKVKIINSKENKVEEFQVSEKEYVFEVEKWGGYGRYFMEIINSKNEIESIYKLNINF